MHEGEKKMGTRWSVNIDVYTVVVERRRGVAVAFLVPATTTA
jgi:hypothetical protein